MTKEQEMRILQNQMLIMQALKALPLAGDGGRYFMSNKLEARIREIQTFIGGEQS